MYFDFSNLRLTNVPLPPPKQSSNTMNRIVRVKEEKVMEMRELKKKKTLKIYYDVPSNKWRDIVEDIFSTEFIVNMVDINLESSLIFKERMSKIVNNLCLKESVETNVLILSVHKYKDSHVMIFDPNPVRGEMYYGRIKVDESTDDIKSTLIKIFEKRIKMCSLKYN